MMQPAKDSIDLGVICGNIQASLHFYQTLLGLEKVGEQPASTGTMHRLRFGSYHPFELFLLGFPLTKGFSIYAP